MWSFQWVHWTRHHHDHAPQLSYLNVSTILETVNYERMQHASATSKQAMQEAMVSSCFLQLDADQVVSQATDVNML